MSRLFNFPDLLCRHPGPRAIQWGLLEPSPHLWRIPTPLYNLLVLPGLPRILWRLPNRVLHLRRQSGPPIGMWRLLVRQLIYRDCLILYIFYIVSLDQKLIHGGYEAHHLVCGWSLLRHLTPGGSLTCHVVWPVGGFLVPIWFVEAPRHAITSAETPWPTIRFVEAPLSGSNNVAVMLNFGIKESPSLLFNPTVYIPRFVEPPADLLISQRSIECVK